MKKILNTFFFLFIHFLLFSQEEVNERPFFFIQITDPQFGFFADNKDFKKETELYSIVIEKINNLTPSFVVITGDFVNNPKDSIQIKEFKRLTKLIDINIPVFLSPGNHDLGQEPNKKDFNFYFLNYGRGNDRFSFNYRSSTFIGFNSVIIKSGKNKKEEKKQFNWLKKELKKARGSQNILLFTHYPFFIKDFNEKENYSNQSIKMREKYFNLFESYQVDAIFSGHLHNNSYSEYGNIQNVITSSAGKQLGNNSPGIRIVKVYKNRIEHDYFTIDKIPKIIEFNY